MTARWLLGTSWKMNLTATEAGRWFDAFLPLVADVRDRDLFVLPPFTDIPLARERLAGTAIAWGAQDVHPDDGGAHTGDVSAAMLADLGCRFVEVGHSERRRDHAESDELVGAKVRAVLRRGMRPVLCIGEPVRDEPDTALALVTAQLEVALASVDPADAAQVVIAYEPVWAIGSGASVAPPALVGQVQRGIHAWLANRYPHAGVPVIYGGSVDETAAAALLAQDGVDGLFVGRRALDPASFAAIAHVRPA